MNKTERNLVNFACMVEEIYILKLNNQDEIESTDYSTFQCNTMLSVSNSMQTTYNQIKKLTTTTDNNKEKIIAELDVCMKAMQKVCFISNSIDLTSVLLKRLIKNEILSFTNNRYSNLRKNSYKSFKEQLYTLLYINLYKDIREKAHQIVSQLNRVNISYKELHIEYDEPVKKPIVSNLSFESELHKLGYNVVRLSEEQRRSLLVNLAIPKLGKKVVIDRLEFFIKLGKNNPKFKTGIALERWEKDLKYVKSLQYK